MCVSTAVVFEFFRIVLLISSKGEVWKGCCLERMGTSRIEIGGCNELRVESERGVKGWMFLVVSHLGC